MLGGTNTGMESTDILVRFITLSSSTCALKLRLATVTSELQAQVRSIKVIQVTSDTCALGHSEEDTSL